jgi:hypothetical protein
MAEAGQVVTIAADGETTVAGPKLYPNAASDPGSPTPAAGDMYFNTVTGQMRVYDGTRSAFVNVSGLSRVSVVDLFADQQDSPVTADWAVNALAPASADSTNSGLTVRLFDDTTEEGIGFILCVPADALNITIKIKSRAETAPGAANTVGVELYQREVPDNAAPGAWSAGLQLTDIDIPTNEFFQYDEQTIALSTLSINAGSIYQFELTRVAPTGGTDLTGDWALLDLTVEFT